MGLKVDQRFYRNVTANTAPTRDLIPGVGKILEIMEVGGNADQTTETVVYIVWDLGGNEEEIVFSTHGDSNQKLIKRFTGDGIKKMSIVLNNREASVKTIGAWYTGALK